ncbi:MAG: hypothetical protein Q8916_12525 [Bacteroidota bacterium]|nr:hypothetical protein [Bacteroidota bacterium]MDP4231218.1 hypothetical protein [Bacteroidota bacterium]
MSKIKYLILLVGLFFASAANAQSVAKTEPVVVTASSSEATTLLKQGSQISVATTKPSQVLPAPSRQLGTDEVFVTAASSDHSFEPKGFITKVVTQHAAVVAIPKPIRAEKMTVTSSASVKATQGDK